MKLFDLDKASKIEFDAFVCEEITKLIPDLINKKSTILDFGCGDGQLTNFVQNAFFKALLYGVDKDKNSIDQASQDYKTIHFSVLDAYTLPFENNTFDVVYAVNVFHHIPTTEYSLYSKEILRVLNTHGRIIIVEFNPYNRGTRCQFKKDHAEQNSRMVSPKEIIALFDNAARSTKVKYYYLSPYFSLIRQYMEFLHLGSLYSVLVRT